MYNKISTTFGIKFWKKILSLCYNLLKNYAKKFYGIHLGPYLQHFIFFVTYTLVQ
jgi:hypothetical protein